MEYVAGTWYPIESAPKEGDLLVWYDHEADQYYDSVKDCLTDYAAWAEGGDFLDGKGYAIAKWCPPHWESVDEYGEGYWLPAWWFAHEDGDYERVVNPTHFSPLPKPPLTETQP